MRRGLAPGSAALLAACLCRPLRRLGLGSFSMPFIEVVGSTADSGPSIYVFDGLVRTLINVPQGSQRLVLSRPQRMRYMKLSRVLVTRSHWACVGGLPGLLLSRTNANAAVPHQHAAAGEAFPPLELCAPQPLLDALRAYDKSLLHEAELGYAPVPIAPPLHTITTADMRIQAITVTLAAEGQPYFFGWIQPLSQYLPPSPDPSLPPDEGLRATVAYLGFVPDLAGNVDRHKLNALLSRLGIEAGEWIGLLKQGQTVQHPCGATITPDMVINKMEPNPCFAVVDVPHAGVVSALLRDGRVAAMLKSWSRRGVVFHLTSRALAATADYQQWLQTMRPVPVEHVLVDVHNGLKSPLEHILQTPTNLLNALDATAFPLPQPTSHVPVVPLPPNFITVPDGHKFGLRHTKRLQATWEETPPPQPRLRDAAKEDINTVAKAQAAIDRVAGLAELTMARDVALLASSPAAAAAAAAAASPPPGKKPPKQRSRSPSLAEDPVPRPPQLLFLGTNSALPTKYRNVTGILVKAQEGGGYIALDTGESWYGQLLRAAGPDGADHVLLNLHLIFCSHMHSDHHAGLADVLLARQRAFVDRGLPVAPVALILPLPFQVFFQQLLKLHPSLKASTTLVDGSLLYVGHDLATATEPIPVLHGGQEVLANALSTLQIRRVQTVAVRHQLRAMGLVLDHQDGWRLVWSGDTRPCSELIEAGREATVLIHEATFEDDMLSDAKMKRHSTVLEAIDVARRMRAETLVLTHFSSRYDKTGPKLDYAVGVGEVRPKYVIPAFDLMRVDGRRVKELALNAPRVALVMQRYLGDEDEADAEEAGEVQVQVGVEGEEGEGEEGEGEGEGEGERKSTTVAGLGTRAAKRQARREQKKEHRMRAEQAERAEPSAKASKLQASGTG